MSGYMLISVEDARRIAEALVRIEQNAVISEAARRDALDALHTLNAGLHGTDEVPEDTQREVRA